MTAIAKLGPGLWFSIHFQAFRAVTPESKLQFATYINQLLQDFPCPSCTDHFRTYLDTYPLINYWHTDSGMFNWSVDFHNSVNTELRKPTLSYSDALKIYQSPEPCSSCIPPNRETDIDFDSMIIIGSSTSIQTVPGTAVPAELLDYLANKK